MRFAFSIVFVLICTYIYSKLFFVNAIFAVIVILFPVIIYKINSHLGKSILILAVLFPFNEVVRIKVMNADIRFIQVLWVILLFLLTMKLTTGRKIEMSKLTIEKYDLLFFCFLLVAIAGLIFLPYRAGIVKEILQWIYLYSLFFILRSFFKHDSNNVKFFVKGILIGSLIFCIFGMVKTFIGTDPIPWLYLDPLHGYAAFVTTGAKGLKIESGAKYLRADAFFLGSVGTANILVIMFFLITATKAKMKNITKLLILIILVLTGSRAAWLIVYFVYIVDAVLRRDKLILKVVGSVVFVVIILVSVPWAGERLLQAFSLKEMSTRSHLAIWSSAIDMFLHYPFFGVGSGNFPRYILEFEHFSKYGLYKSQITSHNLFLQILAENGILGVITLSSFFIVLFLPIIKFYNRIKMNELTRCIIMAFIGSLLMNLTMNAFMLEAFWIILALLVGNYEHNSRIRYNSILSSMSLSPNDNLIDKRVSN